MGKTSIQWTQFSINPLRARNVKTGAVGHFCELMSPGCLNCYSSTMQKRFFMPAFGKSKMEPAWKDGRLLVTDDIEVFLDESKLQEVLSRRKPTTWFWADMTDIFGRWVPTEWIDRCVTTMILTRHHTHQILTKRSQRMMDYFLTIQNDDKDLQRFCNIACELTDSPQPVNMIEETDWPLPNVWLGVSCERQKEADERLPWLLKTPAAIRFASVEPQLEEIKLFEWSDEDQAWSGPGCFVERGTTVGTVDNPPEGYDDSHPGLDLCIVGGESGSKARPFVVEWARDLFGQCLAADCKFFLKQLGANPYEASSRRFDTHTQWCNKAPTWITKDDLLIDAKGRFCRNGGDMKRAETENAFPVRILQPLRLKDRKGGDMEEWPEDLRIREMPEATPVS